MELVILDKFQEEDAVCLLCRTSLREYVEALPSDFKDYYIQRGIVSNRFLDNLWDTISKKKHIPAIVLVTDQKAPEAAVGNQYSLTHPFRVLDGLQRSNRIKEAWDAVSFVNTLTDEEALTPIRLARKFADDLKDREISSALFQRIIKSSREGVNIAGLFDENQIWLEVWFNLSDSQQIQKMLVLNAGHKSVNIKHQVELLFIGYFETLQKALGNATIAREKQVSSLAYSKNRKPGEFHFSHLISAFVSLNAGKPVTTNADFSASKSFDELEDSDSLLGTDEKLLIEFSEILAVLDSKLRDSVGVKWLGREVVLVGIFGAIGGYARDSHIDPYDALKRLEMHVDLFVAGLNLSEFEKIRNSLDLSKVNLGSVNKNAVYRATQDFLKSPSAREVNWGPHFGVQQ